MGKIISFFFIASCIFCNSVFAQSAQVLIKAFDGGTLLNGGSVVAGHAGEIDALSYSQGEAGCTTGDVGCHSSTSDFSFMMAISNASVSFKKLLYNGTALTSVDIYLIRPGTPALTYARVHMENVFISSVQESGSSESPIFAISLTPSKIAWLYRKTSNATPVTYGWDVTQNIEWNYVF